MQRTDRVDFDPRLRLELCGTQLSSDGGLLVMRELDDAFGLSDLAHIKRQSMSHHETPDDYTGVDTVF